MQVCDARGVRAFHARPLALKGTHTHESRGLLLLLTEEGSVHTSDVI